MKCEVYKGFLNMTHVAALLDEVVPLAQWEEQTQNGRAHKWLPERQSFWHPVLQWAIEQARDIMDVPAGKESDVIFLRYEIGDHLVPHNDLWQGRSQQRCGILLEKPSSGGDLYVDGRLVELEPADAAVYRNDLVDHYVTPVRGGCRTLLSVGAVS